MRKIFLDSSVIIAYLIKNDSHHNDAYSLIEFINDKYIKQYNLKSVFITNEIVVLETISKLVHKKQPFKKAKKLIDGFLKKYDIGVIRRKEASFLETIYGLYYSFSRQKARKLQCNDFVVVADSINTGALLATCDNDFLKISSKSYRHIYFISSKSKKHKDQFQRLLRTFFNSI